MTISQRFTATILTAVSRNVFLLHNDRFTSPDHLWSQELSAPGRVTTQMTEIQYQHDDITTRI